MARTDLYEYAHSETFRYWIDLGLSVRASGALNTHAIGSTEQLRAILDRTDGEAQLLRMPNFGRVTLAEVRSFLGLAAMPARQRSSPRLAPRPQATPEMVQAGANTLRALLNLPDHCPVDSIVSRLYADMIKRHPS